jgi:hypothetical protein
MPTKTGQDNALYPFQLAKPTQLRTTTSLFSPIKGEMAERSKALDSRIDLLNYPVVSILVSKDAWVQIPLSSNKLFSFALWCIGGGAGESFVGLLI